MWHILLWLVDLTHTIFRFYTINFQLNTDFPSQFCIFFIPKSPSIAQRSVFKKMLKKNKKKEKKKQKPVAFVWVGVCVCGVCVCVWVCVCVCVCVKV